MMNDTLLRTTGARLLRDKLGRVDAERFISLMIAEPFDYAKWRENLFEEMSLEELADKAQKFCDEQNEGICP